MEIEYDPDQDCDKVLFYIKVLQDNTDLCLVCMTDETEDGHVWDRYQLKCGHVYHSRCLRRWCYHKQSVNFTCCGNIPEDPAYMYCLFCKSFGHAWYSCDAGRKRRGLNNEF